MGLKQLQGWLPLGAGRGIVPRFPIRETEEVRLAMVRKGALILAVVAFLMSPGIVQADTYTFWPSQFPNLDYPPVPPRNDLWDLDHFRAYTWGFGDSSLWNDEVLIGATLTFRNIYNWQSEPNILYVHLLDDPAVGVDSLWENQSGDYFAGQGIELFTWSDPDGPATIGDYVYTFTASDLAVLRAYAASGTWGLGFDPECHFNNCGIVFEVLTAPVPEPATASLLSVSLAGLAWRQSRRRRAA